jgi:membrane protein YdbS with pleckstrin-like domain
VLKEKLSREAWTIIALILLVNVVSIGSSGFLSHAVPRWIHVLEFCMLFVAAIFVVMEVRRQKRQKQILRGTKSNGTV